MPAAAAIPAIVALGSYIASRFGLGAENPLTQWDSQKILTFVQANWNPKSLTPALAAFFQYPIEVRRTWTVGDIDAVLGRAPMPVSSSPTGATFGAYPNLTPTTVSSILSAVPSSSPPRGDQLLATLSPTTQYCASSLVQHLRANGFGVVVTSGKRTYMEQAALWVQYMLGKSKYPAARPGDSDHELGTAVDLAIMYEGRQLSASELTSIDLRGSADYFWLLWGGSGDAVHFKLDTQGLGKAYIAAGQEPPLDVLGPVYGGTP